MRMPSLPIPKSWSEAVVLPPSAQIRCDSTDTDNAGKEDQRFLVHAFRSFSEAASSLERSYSHLRTEVERLRHELSESREDLARSLEENQRIRIYLDRILAGLPCGVMVVSQSNHITRMNPEALRLLNYSNDSADSGLPKSMGELPAEIAAIFEQARTSGREQELRTGSVETGVIWISVKHAHISTVQDQTSIFILRDVSERKRMEQAQEKGRREQALAEMSAVLAHEIRNPLGSLELFAGLLAESNLDGECHVWVEHMQAGLRTLAATVNNVLHFHSLPEPKRMSLDVNEFLAWAKDFFSPLARQSGITLSLQQPLDSISICADRHRLEQVLLNLMLNAVRAMPTGGWIQLSARTDVDGMLRFEVADTGPGIRPKDLPEIFAPGFSTRPGSPGLGLAVCRKIVEQHGGRIWAENRQLGGALFSFTLPVALNLGGGWQ